MNILATFLLIFTSPTWAKNVRVATMNGGFQKNQIKIKKLTEACKGRSSKSTFKSYIELDGEKIFFCDPNFEKYLLAENPDVYDPKLADAASIGSVSDHSLSDKVTAVAASGGKRSTRNKAGKVVRGRNAAPTTTSK